MDAQRAIAWRSGGPNVASLQNGIGAGTERVDVAPGLARRSRFHALFPLRRNGSVAYRNHPAEVAKAGLLAPALRLASTLS
jgi:hypothetical protein